MMHPLPLPLAPHALARAAALALGLAASASVCAQAPAPASAASAPAADAAASPPVQRVTITGSAIKRIDGETALPVHIIKREEIAKAGLTTAAEIVQKVAATATNLTDGGSIGTGGYHDQMGFNSANLRGIGTSSTLVLLNGRRMANFASPGDDAGVDLNNIPAGAIERVEILLDGASAIYGTDAIGGVINFITRRDYQGAEASVYAGTTTEGGARKGSFTLAGGAGDVGEDGFNVFGVFDVQKTSKLNALDRQFISDLRIPERLPYLLSSYSFPGNIELNDAQFEKLKEAGFSTNGKDVISTQRINLSAPNCNPPGSLYLPQGYGGVDGCTFDFMRDLELYPESTKLSLLGRGAFQISADHQFYVEASLAQAKTLYTGTSNRLLVKLDAALAPGFETLPWIADYPAGGWERRLEVRTRLLEAGGRTSEIVSTGQRYVAGFMGTWGRWDYDIGLNHSMSKVADSDVHGYLNEPAIQAGMAAGTVSPFGYTDGAAAFYEANQITGEVRTAWGQMTSLDGKLSGAIGSLEGGDIMLAFGGEYRQEKQKYHQSKALMDDLILGDSPSGTVADTRNKRDVYSAFAELSLPFTKTLELQLALRADHYETIGASLSPKLGVKWKLAPELMLRASAGTGFRAPSLTDLYRPTTEGSTAALPDPQCMADNDNDLAYCTDYYTTRNYSNPNLKPERSRQFSMGLVWEPSAQWSGSIDYWNIRKSDLISTIGDDIILGNPSKYQSLIHRYSDPAQAPGSEFMLACGDDLDPDDHDICYIELHKENRGAMQVSGLDLLIDWRSPATDFGRFSARLAGTYTLSSRQQTADGDPFVSNLGKFVYDGAVQRWRHRLSVDWSLGDVTVTLGNSYLSSHEDQNSAVDDTVGQYVAKNRVAAYSLWDASAAWQATPELRVRAGVQNLFNTAPPFSNQAYFFISGYDPSYTDPRGRFVYVSATYSFR